MKEAENDLLDSLIEHEAVVGRLYQTFAGLFPAHEGLWTGLAAEERGHADGLRELGSDPSLNGWLLSESGLRWQAIRSSIGYVEDQIARAQTGRLSPIQALAIGRDLEGALIEQQFSRMKRPPYPALAAVLSRLTAETERHRTMLAEAVEAARRAIS